MEDISLFSYPIFFSPPSPVVYLCFPPIIHNDVYFILRISWEEDTKREIIAKVPEENVYNILGVN